MMCDFRTLLLCGAASSAVIIFTTGASAQTSAGSPPALAESTIDEIIVTARRQSESLQNVPVAITAFSQQALTQNQVVSSFDLPRVVPGLTVSADTGNPSLPSFSIRGRGQNYGASSGSVETYFADVPLSAPFQIPTLPAQFFDLSSFQILKGPQGTLFGRSTTGGAVLIVPQTPTDVQEGYARVQIGTYNDLQFEAAVNLPFSDRAALRAAAFHWSRDGYMHSRATNPDGSTIYDSLTGTPIGDQTFNNQNVTEVRATLLLKPTDSLQNSTIFTYHLDQVRASTASGLILLGFGDAAPAAGAPGYKTRYTYSDVSFRKPPTNVFAVINTTTLDLSEDLSLKNIFGYINASGYTNDGSDTDGTSSTVISAYVVPRARKNRQITDELQLQGKSFDDRLTWTIGGLVDKTREPGLEANGDPSRLNVISMTNGGAPADPAHPNAAQLLTRYQQNRIDSYGLYAAGAIKLTDKLNLSGGFRHNWDKVQSVQGFSTQLSFYRTPTYSPFANLRYKVQSNVYNAEVDYHPSNTVMIYGGYRRGFKRGGFNSSTTNPADASFGPETINDFHGGVKAEFGGPMRPRFNIEGFYDLYKGYQVSYVTFDSSFNLITLATNVPKTTFRGFEAELTFDPASWVQLHAGYSFTDAYYTSFPDTTLPGANPSLAVNDVTFNSRHKLTAYARFHTDLAGDGGELVLRPQISYQSRFFVSPYDVKNPVVYEAVLGPFNQVAHGGSVVPGYSTVDLRLEWNHLLGSRFDAAINASNITNKLYFLGSVSTLNFGFQANGYGPPRMVNVELSTKF